MMQLFLLGPQTMDLQQLCWNGRFRYFPGAFCTLRLTRVQLSLHQIFTENLCTILWADKTVKLPVDPNYGNNIRQDDESILQCLLCEKICLRTTWWVIDTVDCYFLSSVSLGKERKQDSLCFLPSVLHLRFQLLSTIPKLTNNHNESTIWC